MSTSPSNRRHVAPPDLAPDVPTPLPHLLTIEQIANHLGVSVRHVRRLVAERRIPFVKWGHLLRFDPAKVSAWLATQQVEPFEPEPWPWSRR